MSLHIIDQNVVEVRIPKHYSYKTGLKFVYQKRAWVSSQLIKLSEYEVHPGLNWDNEDKILIFGREISLRILNNLDLNQRRCIFSLNNNQLYVEINIEALKTKVKPQNYLYKKLIQFLKKTLFDFIVQRVAYYKTKGFQKPDSISIRYFKNRLGSTYRSNHIKFNYKLIHLDKFLIDYVVVHELAHLTEFNHSKQFWNIVNKIFPDKKSVIEEIDKTIKFYEIKNYQ